MVAIARSLPRTVTEPDGIATNRIERSSPFAGGMPSTGKDVEVNLGSICGSFSTLTFHARAGLARANNAVLYYLKHQSFRGLQIIATGMENQCQHKKPSMFRLFHLFVLVSEALTFGLNVMRHAIKILTVSAFGICALSGAIAVTDRAIASPDGPEWTYEGSEGPEFWGELSEEFAVCSTGDQQSPIDLDDADAVDADLAELEFDYKSTPLSIVNNGHTIQVNYEPGSTLTLNGQTYELLQFHFHDPSEHTVEGNAYSMEAHLVHQNVETGDFAVVGVLIDIGGEDNSTLKPVWDNFPMEAGPAVEVDGIEVNVAELLPENTRDNYRYYGSLTTPPCSESVNWIVMKEPVTVSFQQVEHFATAVGENARPVQALGRRFVLD